MVEKPYNNEQVKHAISELFDNQSFINGMKHFIPTKLFDYILNTKDEIETVEAFQEKIIYVFLQFIRENTINSLSSNGLENLNKDEKYLVISNHRDIILDSALLNSIFFQNEFTTCQIAIGDNLMQHRISELIFKLNKSFVVKRTGTPRELYANSVALSQYIHETVLDKTDSIWIAQREGRAKDGNDLTQLALLKMLSLSGGKDIKTFFQEARIVPLSISYELDPCALIKTQEYVEKLNNPNYKKSFEQDRDSMLLGLNGDKGKVHFSFGKVLDEELEIFDELPANKQKLAALVQILDTYIQKNYKLFPISFLALDLLNEDKSFKNYYAEEEENLLKYFDKNFEKIAAYGTEAKNYFLGIYANPLKNAIQQGKHFNQSQVL